jgi:hypothetical protein
MIAIVIYLGSIGFACSVPMPLDEALAWVAHQPPFTEIVLRADNPTYAETLARCPEPPQ